MSTAPAVLPVERKKRILIPMIEVGGGHKAIGLAIMDAIERLHPGMYEMAVVDFPKECGARLTDRSVKALWNAALAQPVITNQLNIWMDAVNRVMRSNAITRLFFTDFVRKGMRYIRDFQPDLIVATHFFCTSVAVFAREAYGLDCRIVSHVNDPFRAHALWVNPLADEVVVCSQLARDHMVKLGQNPDSMTILSSPLNPRFFDPITRTREDILAELGLDPTLITLLASSGGEGIGNTEQFIREIYLSGKAVNLIAICGRNSRLLREMNLLAARETNARLVPLGFVRNMNELAFASDIGLAKAGPSTLLEMLSMDCPVMLTHVASQVEQGNLDFVVGENLGWDIRDRCTFEEVLAHISEPDFLEPYRQRIHESGYIRMLPGGAERLAVHLLEGMEKPMDRRIRNGSKIHLRFRIAERRKFKRLKVK